MRRENILHTFFVIITAVSLLFILASCGGGGGGGGGSPVPDDDDPAADGDNIFIAPNPPPPPRAIIAASPMVMPESTNDATLTSITLSTTLRNREDDPAMRTVRWYASNDPQIDPTSDMLVGTSADITVAGMATTDSDITVTRPGGYGITYYGVCLDNAPGETQTDNNCANTNALFDADVPNNINTAPTIAVNSILDGNISSRNDRDMFKIILNSHWNYRFTLQGGGDQPGLMLAAPLLQHLNSSGVVISEKTGVGEDIISPRIAAGGGTYHLRIFLDTSIGATGIGTYRLRVTGKADRADTGRTTTAILATTVGSSVSGEIDDIRKNAADHDWYKITLAKNRYYEFFLDALTIGRFTTLEFYRPTGDDSVSRSDFFPIGFDSNGDRRRGFLVTRAGGDYYLVARGVSSGVTGTYTLAVTKNEPDQPENATTTATVTVGGAAVTGGIQAESDLDRYKVALTQGTSYQFDLKTPSSGSRKLQDPALNLYSPASRTLRSDTDGGKGSANSRRSSRIVYKAESTGEHFLEADEDGGDARGRYELSASLVPAISVGSPENGNISSRGDSVWYRISLTGGVTYQFDLMKAGGNGGLKDPLLTLYASNRAQTQLARDANSGISTDSDPDSTDRNSQFTYTPVTTGEYFLQASEDGRNGIGAYQLSVAVSSP